MKDFTYHLIYSIVSDLSFTQNSLAAWVSWLAHWFLRYGRNINVYEVTLT